MMKYRYKLLMVTMIFLLGLAVNNLSTNAAATPVVSMLDVNGNAHISAEQILGAIRATRIGEPINDQAVQTDLEMIMKIGYFADVRYKTEPFANGIKLTFTVIENPIFKEVRIIGPTRLKPKELQARFTQKTGEVFNSVKLSNDIEQIERYCLAQKGLYLEHKLEKGISSDGIIVLKFTELKLGRIKIVGLHKTKEFVVRRELAVKEGEVFDANVVKEDLARLSRLQLFENINPKVEVSELPHALDLTIELQEATNNNTFVIGGSYQENTGELGGIVEVSENNLMGLGQSISFNFDGSKDEKDISFNYYDPWLNKKGTSLRVGVWNSNSDITSTLKSWGTTSSSYPDNIPYDLDLNQAGIRVALGHKLRRDTTFRVKINCEKNTVENIYQCNDSDQKNSLKKYLNETKHPGEFWDNAIEMELVHNTLQYSGLSFVTGGYQLSGSYKVAGSYLGGEFDYRSTFVEGQWFYPLTANLVFGTRLQGAFIDGDYPDYDQLYLGGDMKLRGYKGKRYTNEYTNGLIGSGYLLANTELRYRWPTHKSLILALFYDAGQLTGSGSHDLKYDYGVGFRYDIPLIAGHLRVDRAWNSDGETRDIISIGEAF